MASRTRKILSMVPPEGSGSPESDQDMANLSMAKDNVPSTSSSRQVTTSKYKANWETLSSSEESDAFEDSGESYVPSEIDQNESLDELSSQESDNENYEHNEDVEVPDVNNGSTGNRWRECQDIPVSFQFSGQVGVKVQTLDLSKPYEIFRQFVSDEVIDIIVVETNRYAAQYLRSHVLRRRSMLRQWKDTNRDEIKKFIAVLIIMGMNHLPKMRLYWSSNDMFCNRHIQKTMKRDRFDSLLKFIHFSNNEDPIAENDRLFKIRNIVNLICNRFKETVSPGDSVVIDESMVPWRGRLVFRQYLPAKSHKYGVKLYKICTPHGYTYDLRVYAGKNAPDAPDNERGHTFNVCMDLLQGLLNEGRTLYIDNYYTSLQLCKALLDVRTYVCGTLRSNRRGNPKTVCQKKLKKGEIYGEQNEDGVRVLKWLDKRPVLMISTVPIHTIELKATGKKNRKGEDILKPPAVISYNKAKKGVDVSDQMSSYYTCLRKTLKWYKKVFFEILLGTCIVNTWVVYNEFGKNRKKMDILQIRELIISELLRDEVENIEAEDDLPANEPQQPRSKKPKTLHKMGKYEGTVRKSRKRCQPCYQKLQNETSVAEARRKTKRVATYCQDCPGQPTMCLPCFNEKH